MTKKKLILARNKIDRLDNSIFNLLKKRTIEKIIGIKKRFPQLLADIIQSSWSSIVS